MTNKTLIQETSEPEKKSFHDFPLQKIFKINTQMFPENISVTEIGFSSRVLNLLNKNNIATLDKLLELSLRDLSNTPGFGKTSVDNVTATLKKFSESKKKKISAKTFNLAKEELDKFLRDAALRHDPQIDLIITAFENFSSNLNKELSLHKPLAQKIKELPTEFKNKKVHLLLHVYDFKDKKPFKELPDDLTLSVFTKWLAEKSLPFDETELINFVDELNVNLKAFSKKLVDATLKKGREFEIVYRRAQKMTLEEVGSIFSITRERVRQIELSAIDKFAKLNTDARKFFYLLHAITDGRAILTLKDVKNFIDDSDAEIIWFLAVRTNLNSEIFSFDKKRNVFVFYDGIDFDEAEFLNRLPKIMSEKFFDETTATFAAEKNCPVELMRERLLKFYKRSGKFLHCGRLTLTFKCGYILKENFPNGYKIADKFFYSRFIYYLRDIFDEKNSLTQRNLDSIIGRIGVLCNRGKYIHPDFVNIPPAIIERVKKFIENSGHTAIFYKEIFESLRKFFAGTQITNHYFLQGVIRFYELPYILRKDYLTKVDEVNIGKEFNRFVEEHGEVSPEDIKKNFVSFKLINKTLLMRRCVEIINIGGGKFLHSARLKLTEDDFKNIKDFLNQTCTTPINSQRLFELFSNRFADFMTRNEIFTHEKLFGIMKYMFSDEFNFSRQHVSIKDVTEINNRKKSFLLKNFKC